ncbi:hypothetical protein [Streptomyces anandii]
MGRGVPVTDDVREHVEACTDPDRLQRWAQQAVRISDARELSGQA